MIGRYLLFGVLATQATISSAQCGCWVEPDSTFTLIDNASMWDHGGQNNPDEGLHGPVALPFGFQYFGEAADSIYIGNNGTVSVEGTPWASGMPVPQQMADHRILAPFWADADLQAACIGCNQVYYKLTPTALYVNWIGIGRYHLHTDKLNTFQLIITDGSDPVLAPGNNVSFCYRDMQWTAGDFQADPPQSGFGGMNALIVASKGDGWPPHGLFVAGFNGEGAIFYGPGTNYNGVDRLDSTGISVSLADTMTFPPYDFVTWGCDTLVAKSQFGISLEAGEAGHPAVMDVWFDAHRDQLWVNGQGKAPGTVRIELFGGDGRLHLAEARSLAAEPFAVSCQGLPSGVYVARITGPEGFSSLRFVRY